jgi:hypothetical protein
METHFDSPEDHDERRWRCALRNADSALGVPAPSLGAMTQPSNPSSPAPMAAATKRLSARFRG